MRTCEVTMTMKAKEFGKALREIRLKKGISRAELAREIGCSYLNVWFWETGRHYPRGPLLVRLFEMFPELIELMRGGNGNGAKRKDR